MVVWFRHKLCYWDKNVPSQGWINHYCNWARAQGSMTSIMLDHVIKAVLSFLIIGLCRFLQPIRSKYNVKSHQNSVCSFLRSEQERAVKVHGLKPVEL